jgi:transposase
MVGVVRRHELEDAEWELVQEIVAPQVSGRGGRVNDPRRLLNGMMWILRTGAPWRDLPDRYGPWKTVYHRFNLWRKQGVIDRMLERLQLKLDENGYIEWDLWCIDGSSVRASKAAAGAGKKGDPKSRQTTP